MFVIPEKKVIHSWLRQEHEEKYHLLIKGMEDSNIPTSEAYKMVYPEEGGLYSFFYWSEVPFPGLPLEDVVFHLASLKQIVITGMKTMFLGNKKWEKLAMLWMIFRQRINLAFLVIEFIYRGLRSKDYIPTKSNKMSHSVREIWRVLNLLMEREKDERVKKNFKMFRDVICMILEYDTAYRFRFQDVFSEIDIDKLKLDEIDRYWAERQRRSDDKTSTYNWGFKQNETERRENNSVA